MRAHIRPVTRKTRASNRYCGPAAISAIIGADTAETARVLRLVTGKRAITGVDSEAMRGALARYGFKAETVSEYARSCRPTLASWLRRPCRTGDKHVYLILAGGHWQVVQGDRYVCGITEVVVPVDDKRVRRRARVAEVLIITPSLSARVVEA